MSGLQPDGVNHDWIRSIHYVPHRFICALTDGVITIIRGGPIMKKGLVAQGLCNIEGL